MASLVGQSLRQSGWPTKFASWQSVRLEDLPLAQAAGSFPTEAWFDEDRISQFMEAGINLIVGPKRKDFAFSPSDVTMSKVPLSHQMLVSRLSHLLLWCKDSLEESLASHALQEALENAFFLFWEKTGQDRPAGLKIAVASASIEGRIPIKITLTPSRNILATQQKVELDFFW
jgi:hypothetical protein